MKKRRSSLVLLFALVLGAIAAALVWGYMQQVQKEADRVSRSMIALNPTAIPGVPVLVAAKDIPMRARITAEMVAVREMPPSAKHANAFSAVSEVEGKVTKLSISQGEQVISNKIALQRDEVGLAFTIPPSKRAIAITTSEVISSGGLIIAGDFVDVIGVFDKETMGKDMAGIILQNVEVLAVAQTLQGEVEVEAKGPIQQVGDQLKGAQPTPTPVVKAKPQPQAKTVTLAVTPEEAQRLLLAEARGSLRLALRPAKEGATVSLPPALLGTIQAPLETTDALITAVDISPANAHVGDTLNVSITVKNTSTGTLKTQGPAPQFSYVQGQTFHSQEFPSQDGSWRVGINLDAQSPVPFPYRWGFGADLPPGASTTVTGSIKLTYDITSANFWAGLIKEPANVVQNNVGTTLVTIAPSDVAVVSVDAANVRSGPSIDSSVVAKIEYGTQLPVLGHQADWYRVKLPDGREGWMAAGWIVAPPAR